MSTRATIGVHDDYGSYYIYRHHDGYPNSPHGVIETLKKALPFAWPLPRFEADDFAAAIVRAWKDLGGDIRLTTDHEAHSDTKYQYDIYQDEHRQLWVAFSSASDASEYRVTFTSPNIPKDL